MNSSIEGSSAQTQLAHFQELWLKADWQELIQPQADQLKADSQRGLLAAYVAAAQFQVGNIERAREWIDRAAEWGIEKSTMLEILVAGVHNTFGRSAALIGEGERMKQHFAQAIDVSPLSTQPLAAHTRTVHELTRLGCLPQATEHIAQEIVKLLPHAISAVKLETHLTILKAELGLLQSELSIAQRRNQLTLTAIEEDSPNTLADAEEKWLAGLKNRATSQLGQELWVLERTHYKRGGFFVEFGATNGVLLSNSYLLEKEFGWNGICAEPNPRSFIDLKKNRRCVLDPSCIGATTGEEVEFIFAEAYGGMARDADLDNHRAKREAYRDAGDTAVLTTISLHDFLTFHNAPKHIDYISIDTEGSEFSILENFPFDEWEVQMFTIEHNFTAQRWQLRALLEANGYLCQEAQWDDWYYLQK